MNLPVAHSIAVDETLQANVAAWLVKHARQHGLRYLLAHADDGVIWGRVDGDQLRTSNEAVPQYSPRLRPETLQQCRLFGEAGELLLWRADDGWLARLIQEHPSEGDPFDEYQLLWGTRETFFPDVTFTLLREGAQGFHHAVPIEVGLNQRVRLRVRHFIEYNPDGEARIALSRLVAFELA